MWFDRCTTLNLWKNNWLPTFWHYPRHSTTLSFVKSLLKGRNSPIWRHRAQMHMDLSGTDGLSLSSGSAWRGNISKIIYLIDPLFQPVLTDIFDQNFVGMVIKGFNKKQFVFLTFRKIQTYRYRSCVMKKEKKSVQISIFGVDRGFGIWIISYDFEDGTRR